MTLLFTVIHQHIIANERNPSNIKLQFRITPKPACVIFKVIGKYIAK